MEHLVINLKENLILRRKNEANRMLEIEKDTGRDLLLISSGKISELDFLIESLEEMIDYNAKIKKLQQ